MYASPDETLAALERVGYFTDQKTATTVYLAGKLHRPIMLEGPAGAGKTELATSVARAYGVPLLRLQCYQGINEEKAIGQYDKSLQELYVLLMSKSDHDARLGRDQARGDQPRLFHGRPICSKRSSRSNAAFCSSTKSIKWTMHSKQCCSSCFQPGRSRSPGWAPFRQRRYHTFF